MIEKMMKDIFDNFKPISESSIMTELERQAAGIIDDPILVNSDLPEKKDVEKWIAEIDNGLKGEEAISHYKGTMRPGDKGDSST